MIFRAELMSSPSELFNAAVQYHQAGQLIAPDIRRRVYSAPPTVEIERVFVNKVAIALQALKHRKLQPCIKASPG